MTDGHTTTDFVYQWRQDETGSVQNAIKVSKELSSLRFNVAAVNVRQEEIALGPSTNIFTFSEHLKLLQFSLHKRQTYGMYNISIKI